jgi:hypothetical protein
MLRNLKENIGVIVYKNTQLSAYGKFTFALLVFSVALAITSFFIPSSAFLAMPVSILSVVIVAVQLAINYKEQISSSFNKIEISPQASKLYEDLNQDNTQDFEIISLPSKECKVSYSKLLNRELLSNKQISFSKEENFEKVLLNNWRENKKNLGKFLVFKSQGPGYLFNEKKSLY